VELPLQTVVLTRAVDGDRACWAWHRAASEGKAKPRAVTLVLLAGPGGPPLHAWILRDAHPVRWTGPGLDAMGPELAMEELELTYTRVDWVSVDSVQLPDAPPPPPPPA
jgi:phage tail-like protein